MLLSSIFSVDFGFEQNTGKRERERELVSSVTSVEGGKSLFEGQVKVESSDECHLSL